MTCKDICKLVYSERREKKTSSPLFMKRNL